MVLIGGKDDDRPASEPRKVTPAKKAAEEAPFDDEIPF
jgi:hypothetical protein